jgi:hypothetical protein
MSIVLQDPVQLEVPAGSPVRPAAPLDPGPARGAQVVTSDLESRGGYLRTVTGTIAYLDNEAQTYMVVAPDGALIRVPLRDVKKAIESVAALRPST